MMEYDNCSRLSTVVSMNSTFPEGQIDQHTIATTDILYSSILVVLAIVIVVGNVFIILCFRKTSQFSSNFKIYTASLALADLGVGLICIPKAVAQILLQEWPLGVPVCLSLTIVDYWLTNVSVLLLLSIAYDRYKCVTSPLLYRTQFTKRRAVTISAAMWILGFLIWATLILGGFLSDGSRVILLNGMCSLRYKYATFVISTAAFYSPVIFLVIAYVALLLSLKRRMKGDGSRKETRISAQIAKYKHRETDDETPGIKRTAGEKSFVSHRDCIIDIPQEPNISSICEVNHNDVDIKPSQTLSISANLGGARLSAEMSQIKYQNRQCSKTMSVIIFMFLLCWMPMCITGPLDKACEGCFPNSVHVISFMLIYTNSAINPLIHVLTNGTIRARMIGMFQRR